jgi:hypothetical protein
VQPAVYAQLEIVHDRVVFQAFLLPNFRHPTRMLFIEVLADDVIGRRTVEQPIVLIGQIIPEFISPLFHTDCGPTQERLQSFDPLREVGSSYAGADLVPLHIRNKYGPGRIFQEQSPGCRRCSRLQTFPVRSPQPSPPRMLRNRGSGDCGSVICQARAQTSRLLCLTFPDPLPSIRTECTGARIHPRLSAESQSDPVKT